MDNETWIPVQTNMTITVFLNLLKKVHDNTKKMIPGLNLKHS